ncbi:MAG: DUF2934 domain-containing protein [Sedimenticola sp.]
MTRKADTTETSTSTKVKKTSVKKKATSKKKVAKKRAATKKKVAKKSIAKKRTTAKTAATVAANRLNAQYRYEMIATVAHHRAAEREFAPGHELNDWLWAETVVDDLLAKSAEFSA